MGKQKILLYKVLKNDPEFSDLFDNLTESKEVGDLAHNITIEVSRVSAFFKNIRHNPFKEVLKPLNKKTLYRFLQNIKDGDNISPNGIAYRVLMRYVIFVTYQKEKEIELTAQNAEQYKNDVFQYARNMKADLLSVNSNISHVELWRLMRNWYLYISCNELYYRLPLRFIYHSFDSPMDIELKSISNLDLKGTAESGFSSIRGIPEKELWCEASGRNTSFQLRIHLDESTLKGDLLTSGIATFNHDHPETSKSVLYTCPLLLEPADYLSFKDENVQRMDIGDIKTIESNLFNSNDKAQGLIYFDRRPDFSVDNFSPNNIYGLGDMNALYSKKHRNFYIPQKPSDYEYLKERLTIGEWYGLSRITTDEDSLSLVKYKITYEDDKRNIRVERFNSAGDSHLIGFIDRTGFHISMILRGYSGNRNGFLAFEMRSDDQQKPMVFHTIGVSRHDGSTPVAWRELLIQFPKNSADIPKIFKDFSKNNISYKEFIDINEKILSRTDKLYIANRDQGILSFPTGKDSFMKQYLRQQKAFHYCNCDYVVFVPYSYDDSGDLFQLRVRIDELTQVDISLQYRDLETAIEFNGWVSRVGNSLNILAFTKELQYIQVMCNAPSIPSSNIVLDGIVLGTDKYGHAISSPCFMVKADLFSKGDVPKIENRKACIIKQESKEYKKLMKILEKYFDASFSDSKKLNDYFSKSRAIKRFNNR